MTPEEREMRDHLDEEFPLYLHVMGEYKPVAVLNIGEKSITTTDGEEYPFQDENIRLLWRNRIGETSARSPGMCGTYAAELIGR